MNKKILLASLGVITLSCAVFMNSEFLSLTSSVLTGSPSDTTIINKRYFVSEDGKNMYTLTYNQDGSRKYSVEIPKEYTETYTDEYGSHEQPIVWPFTDFPREAVSNISLSTDYYLSSAVTKWATWYKKEYTQYFEKELVELRSSATSSKEQVDAANERLKKQQEVVKACTEVTVPVAEKKLSDASEKLSNDSRDQKLLADSMSTVTTKETELSRLLSTITISQNELTKELNKTIPARLAEIKKIITANDATVKSNTAKITANTKTIVANQKKIDTNAITFAANERKMNDNNITIAANEEALKGEMLPAKRNALKTAQAALIKATNTLKTTQENLTKATNTLKETNATLTTKNTELTQANETFATKKADLITERDTTLPARKTEINTLLTTVWGPYNTLKNEVDTLKKSISKMPTAKEFETKIANDTKAVADAETAYAKAKTACETETGKIAGIQKQLAWVTNWANNLTDKLAKMTAVERGNTPLCSLIQGKIHLEDEEGGTTFKGRRVSLGQGDPKRFRIGIAYTSAQSILSSDFYIDGKKVTCPDITENITQESTEISTTGTNTIPECSEVIKDMQMNNPQIQFICTGQYSFSIEGELIQDGTTPTPEENTRTAKNSNNSTHTILTKISTIFPIAYAEEENCSNGASNYPTCDDNQNQYCTNKSNNYPDCNNVCENNATNPPECDNDISKVCGDGIKGDDEECDDGNDYGGDGCSSSCTVETEECTDDATNFLGSNIFGGSKKVCNLGCKYNRTGVSNFDPKANKDDGSCKCDNGLDFYSTTKKHINSCQCDLKYEPENGVCVKAECKNGLDADKYPLCQCPGIRDTIVNGECKTYSTGRTTLVGAINIGLGRLTMGALSFDDAFRPRIPLIR